MMDTSRSVATLLVMKFGGTSVRDAGCLRRMAAIVRQRGTGGAVVVVSAAAGVTRRLLECGRLAAAGDRRGSEVEVAGMKQMHRATLRDLSLPGAELDAAGRRLNELFDRLRTTLDGIARDGEYPAQAQDAVISFGERFSSTLAAAAARRAGLAVESVDATAVIVTDERFRAARPDFAAIRECTAARLAPALRAGRVVLTEGFIGATPTGAITTMGFEASDLSAALLGAALGAAEVQIWTDVPGMLTTGHRAVSQPRVVPRLSYDEAAELALFGAKVLHPDTVAPARQAGIPVRILHAADPAGEGTWIDAIGEVAGEPVVRAIAVTEDAADDSFAGVRATLLSEHPEGWNGRAIVCPVGRGIGVSESIVRRIADALAGIERSQRLAPRPDALPIAVPREGLDAIVARLHARLIEDRDGPSTRGPICS